MQGVKDRWPALVENDPLEVGLLPTDPGWLEVSHDAPSQGGVRPFGLTYVSVVPTEKIVVIEGTSYDPVRQIAVDAEGVPAIYSAGRRDPSHCTRTTREDGQTWTDQPADD